MKRSGTGLLLLVLAACDPGPLPDFDALWNFDDPAATEQRFLEVLERGPVDSDYRVQLTTQLARAVGLQGRFDEAIGLLDSVAGELPALARTTRARWLLEQGRIYNSSGSPLLARRPFEQAFDVASPAMDTASAGTSATVEPELDRYAVDAAHMLAIISEGKDGIAWNQRAIAIAEKSQDRSAHDWLGSLYNNLGFAELNLGRYEAALKTHRLAEVWFEQKGDERGARISRWAVGKTLRLLDRCDEALVVQQTLETALAGSPDGYVFEEIAECRLVQGDVDAARVYFGKALDLLNSDSWLLEHEPDRLERIGALAQPPAEEPAAAEKAGKTS